MKKDCNRLFEIDENSDIKNMKLVPPLKLCLSPKIAEKDESSSFTFRMKKRILVHKSLDFNLGSNNVLTPKVVRADHKIIPGTTPKALTCRKINFDSTITLNNRRIPKNLLLDSI
jgi:hypothetical protein